MGIAIVLPEAKPPEGKQIAVSMAQTNARVKYGNPKGFSRT